MHVGGISPLRYKILTKQEVEATNQVSRIVRAIPFLFICFHAYTIIVINIIININNDIINIVMTIYIYIYIFTCVYISLSLYIYVMYIHFY